MTAPRMGAGAVKVAPAVTPWFPPEVNPVRVGYYQRDYKDASMPWPDKWDGKRWQLCSEDGSIIGAASVPMPWRGLAADPSKAGV